MDNTKRKWLWLLIFLFICFAVEVLGSWFTASSVTTWYPTLQKPAWNPPNWLFGPVWTFLYGLMAVAVWLIWLKQQYASPKESFAKAYLLFSLQLFLNCIWSGLFFWMQNPALALIDILLLWIVIVLTMLEFKKHVPFAALLLAPYLLWITYAVTLNTYIWIMNR